MKKLILFAFVIMTITVLGQQNDSTRYKYEIKYQVKAKPTKTVTNKHYSWFNTGMERTFKRHVFETMPNAKVAELHNVNAMALDSTIAELLKFELNGVQVFNDIFIEAIIYNKTLDEKYHCWYISGKYQNHIVTETFDPYNPNDWTTIQ